MIFKMAVNFKMAVKQLILTVVEVSLNETRKVIELKLLLCQKETAIIWNYIILKKHFLRYYHAKLQYF